MSQFRQDPIVEYWVAISEERRGRPLDFKPGTAHKRQTAECPFCAGNEHLTPPAVLSYPGTAPGSWRLRVIPNKYPAILSKAGGMHEVIVESAEHRVSLGELGVSSAVDLLMATGERIRAMAASPGVKYIQLFKNNGPGAGASLEHSHSQLLALPVVPPQVALEVEGCRKHFERQCRCFFCELAEGSSDRIISADQETTVLAPFAPRVPYETWIVPKQHASHFERADTDSIRAVAESLHWAILRLEQVLERPDYNVVLHTSPVHDGPSASYHWHVEILPRVSGIGGFEWGTGCHVHSVPPEESTRRMRGD